MADLDSPWITIGLIIVVVIVFLGPVAIALFIMNRPKPTKLSRVQKDNRRGFEVSPPTDADLAEQAPDEATR